MSYPPTKPDATFFDADSDKISESRSELETAVNALNTVIDTIDTSGITTNQILVWNGTKFVPGSQLAGGFTAVQVQLTNGGSYTLAGGNKHYFIEVGHDDNDSSGNLSIDLNVDNLEGSEVFFITLFSATEDGTGGGAVDVVVNWKYSGSLLNSETKNADLSEQIMCSVMTLPAQTQYADNYNADLRIHQTTLTGAQINWTL
jgi:hypothetical protein